jgi:hypothetical protein
LWSRLLSSSYSRNRGVCGVSSYVGLEAILNASIMALQTGFESAEVAPQAYWPIAVPVDYLLSH